MKVLFGVASPYQLFNAIILRRTVYADDSCDVRLADYTDWDVSFVERLKALNVFDSVAVVEMVEFQKNRFEKCNADERRRLYTHPDAYFSEGVFADSVYDVLCYGVAHLHWRMFYYLERTNGLRPQVWFLEEGIQSYTRDTIHQEAGQLFSKNAYPKDVAFSSNICGIYLHQPQLYSVARAKMRCEKIDSPLQVEGLPELLYAVFGSFHLPEQRYIYLEDFFYANGLRTNDVQLLQYLSDIVGRDNIIVKRHPRDSANRFNPLGYREYPGSNVPWEVQLLNPECRRKILVSVTSSALFTPHMVFGYPMHVISLEKMFEGENPEYKDSDFRSFKNRLVGQMNENGTMVHCPRTVEELRDVISYLEFVLSKEFISGE